MGIGACFRAIAMAHGGNTQGGQTLTDVTSSSEREYTIAVLLQIVVDGIARHHPDCAAYAAAARTPSRLRALAMALTAGAQQPDTLIATAVVALGTDTLTALASDPLLFGPICQLVGPASAPALAARLELDVGPNGVHGGAVQVASIKTRVERVPGFSA
jgi:hypothetical protein